MRSFLPRWRIAAALLLPILLGGALPTPSLRRIRVGALLDGRGGSRRDVVVTVRDGRIATGSGTTSQLVVFALP